MVERAHSLLIDWLAGAELGQNGRLPAERDLAERLGLSRAELRKGLAGLEREGRLTRHVGRGTFLRDAERSPTGGAAAVETSSASWANAVAPRDLIRARLVFEPAWAALAALNATRDQLSALADSLSVSTDGRATVSEKLSLGEYEEKDLRFHRALVHATGNPLLVATHDLLAEARAAVDWRLLLSLTGFQETHPGWRGEHEAIAQAVIRRDPERAESAMRHHILVEANSLMGGVG